MKTYSVELSLVELQEAVQQYCLTRGHDARQVLVVSYEKTVLVIDLEPNGLVSAEAFAHRAN